MCIVLILRRTCSLLHLFNAFARASFGSPWHGSSPCYRLAWESSNTSTHADAQHNAGNDAEGEQGSLQLLCWSTPQDLSPANVFRKDAACQEERPAVSCSAENLDLFPTLRWLRDRLLPKVVEWTLKDDTGPLRKWRLPASQRPFKLEACKRIPSKLPADRVS